MKVVILIIILWYAGLFFQTFFLHRYSAHQTFTMSKINEKICFFLTWLFQGSNYLSAYGYGVMHRMHHAYADTEKDPHSPKFDKNVFAMMWRTKNTYQDINNKRIEVDKNSLKTSHNGKHSTKLQAPEYPDSLGSCYTPAFLFYSQPLGGNGYYYQLPT